MFFLGASLSFTWLSLFLLVTQPEEETYIGMCFAGMVMVILATVLMVFDHNII